MVTFQTMLGIVLLFAALLIPGYILGKTKLVEKSAMVSFSNILMYIAMPFLVFSKLLEIDIRSVGLCEISIAALLPIFSEAVLLLLCKLFFRGKDGRSRAMTFCAIFPNCGFLGIPLASAIWPDRPEIVLYISIFNVVSTFLLLTLGVYVLSGDKRCINLKKSLLSPITFAIVLGVICSLLGVSNSFPSLLTYSTTLAQLTTPLAMIALGIELSALHPIKMWKSTGVLWVSLLKLIVAPLPGFAIISLLKFVFRVEMCEGIAFAMLIACAVSTAASAPAMAKKYGADSEYAATLTLANTVLCVITLPLLYMLFDLVF